MAPNARMREALYPGASLMGVEEEAAVARVMRSRSLFRYYGLEEPREVASYEREWAAYAGVRHALAVNSGTSALFCALAAAGVRRDDEVILPAFAWSSDANVVLQLGAIPVIADVDESLTLDPAAVERLLTERTRVILPVHMRGAPADMEPLMALAADAGVAVIEDACQAAGVRYRDRAAGSWGQLGAFSTQYAKLVSTGEGGVVVTNDEACYQAALDVHDPGASLRRGAAPSEYPGLNLRCTELQASVGRVQLARLPEIVATMRRHAAQVREAVLRHGELMLRALPSGAEDNGVAVIFFAESAAAAAAARDSLRQAGVTASLLHEPDVTDLHVADSWRPVHVELERRGRPQTDISASLSLLRRAVQLDLHPLYTEADVDAICDAVDAL